jgi:hypothetical protein
VYFGSAFASATSPAAAVYSVDSTMMSSVVKSLMLAERVRTS